MDRRSFLKSLILSASIAAVPWGLRRVVAPKPKAEEFIKLQFKGILDEIYARDSSLPDALYVDEHIRKRMDDFKADIEHALIRRPKPEPRHPSSEA